MKKTLFLSVLIVFMAVFAMQAQDKYGHLNYGNFLSSMPATKKADKDLEALSKQLLANGEKKALAFQAKYEDAVKKIQEGVLTPNQQKILEEELQKEQKYLQEYESNMMQQIEKKRQDLLLPIVNNVNKAIEEVAQANGYKMIFDTSVFNSVLFVRDTDDITALLKAKLGIN